MDFGRYKFCTVVTCIHVRSYVVCAKTMHEALFPDTSQLFE
jgi:hypothetical protein